MISGDLTRGSSHGTGCAGLGVRRAADVRPAPSRIGDDDAGEHPTLAALVAPLVLAPAPAPARVVGLRQRRGGLASVRIDLQDTARPRRHPAARPYATRTSGRDPSQPPIWGALFQLSRTTAPRSAVRTGAGAEPGGPWQNLGAILPTGRSGRIPFHLSRRSAPRFFPGAISVSRDSARPLWAWKISKIATGGSLRSCSVPAHGGRPNDLGRRGGEVHPGGEQRRGQVGRGEGVTPTIAWTRHRALWPGGHHARRPRLRGRRRRGGRQTPQPPSPRSQSLALIAAAAVDAVEHRLPNELVGAAAIPVGVDSSHRPAAGSPESQLVPLSGRCSSACRCSWPTWCRRAGWASAMSRPGRCRCGSRSGRCRARRARAAAGARCGGGMGCPPSTHRAARSQSRGRRLGLAARSQLRLVDGGISDVVMVQRSELPVSPATDLQRRSAPSLRAAAAVHSARFGRPRWRSMATLATCRSTGHRSRRSRHADCRPEPLVARRIRGRQRRRRHVRQRCGVRRHRVDLRGPAGVAGRRRRRCRSAGRRSPVPSPPRVAASRRRMAAV